MSSLIKSEEYKNFIKNIKNKIYSSQIKAGISVNKEMLMLYWNIAEMIVEKQEKSSWGSGFINEISKDLKKEFPEMKGFSKRNLLYMKRWFLYWNEIVQQAVAQLENIIPWGHNIVIIEKIKDIETAIFYINKTIENNWSRAVLVHQIESGLYNRHGKAINNFKENLPAIQSDLAKQVLKDPYCFDFLTLTEDYNERELENALVDNITQFLLELGAGFSYLGRQYKLNVGGDDFYIDLLFYHVKLHSYVVVELKTVKFIPEFAGKLNFYISAVDGILATETDNPTIGICKSKNDTVVEYSLKDVNKAIGVSEYQLTNFFLMSLNHHYQV